MAEFCKQCSIQLFGSDFGDFKRESERGQLSEGEGWMALCEGCGPTLVDDDGVCISRDCFEQHGITLNDIVRFE